MKKYLAAVLMINMLLISFPLNALAQEPPQTVQEAETLGLNILRRLPGAIKDVWRNEALPLLAKMWGWVKDLWASSWGAKVRSLLEKLWSLTGQKQPNAQEIKQEFQKEKDEMQQDLWTRFKGLF